MGPTGIEPVPLVLQTSVRTSYTKGPSERYYQLYYRATNDPDGIRTHTSPLSGILWNRTTRFLQQRFYRPLITPVTEASQFAHSTGIEPASPPSTGSVVTNLPRTKL